MTRPFILSVGIGDPELSDPAHAAQILTLAESAGVDMLLLGEPSRLPFDAQVIAAWAAPRLSRMAVVPLVSTRTAHPFHTARSLSSIDYLCGGRLGWCPVSEGQSAGQLADLVLATRALWDGWDADCLIIDKATGRYLDAAKVRASNYLGSHYQTRGPVNAMRPLQGHPVLVCDANSPFAVPAVDVVIADDGQAAPLAERRLLRAEAELDIKAVAARFASGEIHGLHIPLANPRGQLPQIGRSLAALTAGRPASGTLRQRLGLPSAKPATTKIKETV